MTKAVILLCAAALAWGADDPWAKVKELKSGTELKVYKRGSTQPQIVKFDELTDENLVVVNKNEQVAIARDQVDRIESRQSGSRTRTTTDTATAESHAATDQRSNIPGPNQPPGAMHAPTSTTTTGVTWTKQDFEVIYRRSTGGPPKAAETTKK